MSIPHTNILPPDILEEAGPILKKGRALIQERNAENLNAIQILENRRRSATFDIELPGGDVIPIRARLSKTELRAAADLFHKIAAAHKAKKTDAVEELTNQLIGMILYIDGMTPAEIADWLNDNPDSFSDLDAAEIVIGFGVMLEEEKDRQERLAKFREK